MDILVEGSYIIATAPDIERGLYDEPFEKWKLSDENGGIMYFLVNDNCSLVKNVTLPEEYTPGKYFYENGEFVLDKNWKPRRAPEQRIEDLEEQVATHEDNDAELLYQICLLQLGITEEDTM